MRNKNHCPAYRVLTAVAAALDDAPRSASSVLERVHRSASAPVVLPRLGEIIDALDVLAVLGLARFDRGKWARAVARRPATVVVLLDRLNVEAVFVFSGKLSDDDAVASVCAELNADELASFNAHPPIADAENWPCADDVPSTWTAETLREEFHVEVAVFDDVAV